MYGDVAEDVEGTGFEDAGGDQDACGCPWCC